MFLDPTTLIQFAQLVLAAILGLALGTERTIAGKRAGMRTFSLVSMGSALFVITGTTILGMHPDAVSDITRIPAAAITGIGFLGAGVIILRKETLKGLTTAAGLWVAAGVGIAVGFKAYSLAIFATLLTLLVFTVLWILEQQIRRRVHEATPVRVAEDDAVTEVEPEPAPQPSAPEAPQQPQS